jgi:hypothetical protein
MANFFDASSQQTLSLKTYPVESGTKFALGIYGWVNGLKFVSTNERVVGLTSDVPQVVTGGQKQNFMAVAVGKADVKIVYTAQAGEPVWDMVTVDVGPVLPKIAFGAKVSYGFKAKVIDICKRLGMDPNQLMACMYRESAGSLSPSKWNTRGADAVGLLQFTGPTAINMGTTTAALAAMSAVDQLDYVEKFFQPYKSRLRTVGDVYCAMFCIFGIGKPPDFVLYDASGQTPDGRKHPTSYYTENANFDIGKKLNITKGDLMREGQNMVSLGLSPANIG